MDGFKTLSRFLISLYFVIPSEDGNQRSSVDLWQEPLRWTSKNRLFFFFCKNSKQIFHPVLSLTRRLDIEDINRPFLPVVLKMEFESSYVFPYLYTLSLHITLYMTAYHFSLSPKGRISQYVPGNYSKVLLPVERDWPEFQS